MVSTSEANSVSPHGSQSQSNGSGHGAPSGQPARGGHGAASAPRVSVAFTFLKVRPEAFALSTEERARLVAEFDEIASAAADHLGILRPYSLVGLRADADVLLWQAADSPDALQRYATQLRTAGLFRYLEMPYQYLAMTRRSMYVDSHVHEGQDGRRTHVRPAGAKYLFIYPFVKTRAWYALPMEERQKMMDEHIAVGHRYPGVKINTTYSFGLDDQEFVVAFEGDSPSEFLDLVMELRSSRASAYTLRDTPAFTAVSQPLSQAFSLALGTAQEAAEPAALELAAAVPSPAGRGLG